jgi:hypothetical protein
MTIKRFSPWTSKKSFLAVGLLLLAFIFGAATWSRSRATGDQRNQTRDVVTSLSAAVQPDAATKARIKEAYGQLPLSFEANVGQADPQVDFISRGSGYTLFLSPREAVLALPSTSPPDSSKKQESAVLRMKFVGSEAKPRVVGHEKLPGKINYFIGKDRSQWRAGVSTYAKVGYENLYPGVDLVYYGNQRQLEYDFVVRPGIDPNVIALSFDGADQLQVDAAGELVLRARGSEIRQRKPVIYQEVNGVRQEVAGSYKLKDPNTVGFELGDYDTSKPLVIDPVLVYSTFLGGANVDAGFDITVDAAGNAYVTGHTQLLIVPSTFPTTPGAFDTTHNGSFDAFVTKLNPSGSALVYSTFLGGSDLDSGSGIAVDSTGNAYVTGTTFSPDFPTTAGALDTTLGGVRDAFVTKLNPTGAALVYSTYFGGSETDLGGSIAVDSSGNAYVSGNTMSFNFPTTPGAFDTILNSNDVLEAFVMKLNPSGSALVYSTLLGGSNGSSSNDIALDASGSVYVIGSASSADFPTTPGAFDTTFSGGDVFVTKLNATGTAPIYSTFLGGTARDEGRSIAIDASGNAYATGITLSPDFPTTAGAFDTTYNGNFDAFVTKLNSSGSALVYSTYLGDVDFVTTNDIAVDASGSVYVTGSTSSPNFPTTADAFDTTFNGGPSDVFVTQFNASGSALVYSTLLGGSGDTSTGIADDEGLGIALDNVGGIYVTGSTRSANFPTTPGAFDTTHNGVSDAFVTKFGPSPVSTSPCQITGGGWIIAQNGDRATFGGNAKADESGETEGAQSFVDHGPAQRLNLQSLNVLTVVCDGSSASIFGQASINGSDVVNYQINVQDVGGPGRGQDTYQLIINGYDSGEQVLRGGNIQIRQK